MAIQEKNDSIGNRFDFAHAVFLMQLYPTKLRHQLRLAAVKSFQSVPLVVQNSPLLARRLGCEEHGWPFSNRNDHLSFPMGSRAPSAANGFKKRRRVHYSLGQLGARPFRWKSNSHGEGAGASCALLRAPFPASASLLQTGGKEHERKGHESFSQNGHCLWFVKGTKRTSLPFYGTPMRNLCAVRERSRATLSTPRGISF